jgi:glycosyltransferase involved in cell wall biosynthesis
MNVLFLIHRYPPAVGGSERLIQALARMLVGDGHQATIYTSDVLDMEGFWQRGQKRLDTGLTEDEGVQIRRFPARVLPLHGAASGVLGLFPWAPVGLTMAPPGLVVPGLWRAVRQGGDWDLVHASAYPSLMYLGSVAARRSKAGLVLMPCTHPGVEGQQAQRHYFLSRRLVQVYGQAGAVIALTDSERRLLVQAGIPSERVYVSGVGIDPEEAAGAHGKRFRHEFNLADDAPIVTFVGHKTPGKGALYLLDAGQALLAKWPDLILALVGAPTAEFTRRYEALPGRVRSRVLNLRLSEQGKHDLLAASSVLVLPSRDDSFGIVLLEAWLHGKPVIGARAGGIPDVVEEGKTGLLVPYGDPTALVEAIGWILDNPEEATRMGRLGRQLTLEQWTWKAVYCRVKEAYHSARMSSKGINPELLP